MDYFTQRKPFHDTQFLHHVRPKTSTSPNDIKTHVKNSSIANSILSKIRPKPKTNICHKPQLSLDKTRSNQLLLFKNDTRNTSPNDQKQNMVKSLSNSKMLFHFKEHSIDTQQTPKKQTHYLPAFQLCQKNLKQLSQLCQKKGVKIVNEQFGSKSRSLADAMKNKELYCIAHCEKKAKYVQIKQDGNNVYYCSKCAVQLASIGVKIEELTKVKENSQNSIQKESELNLFLESLDQQKLMYYNELLISGQIKFDQWFKEQQELIKCQFDQMIEIVRNKQQQILLELNNEKTQLFIRIKQFKTELIQYNKDIDNIKQDINLNYNQVVNSIELKTFKDIMFYYQQRLSKVKDFVMRMKKEKFNLKYFVNGNSIMEILDQLLTINEGVEEHYLIDTMTRQVKTQPSEGIIQNKLYISFDDKDGFQSQNIIDENENESSTSNSPTIPIKHPTFRQLFDLQDKQKDKIYQIEQLDIQCEE